MIYHKIHLNHINLQLKKLFIELDVHILKDNNIVVFHYDNLKRMTNIDKKLKNLTYEEFQNKK